MNYKVTDGTDQDSRKLPALEAGYFNVDELTFESLLAMGADFSSAINFFDLQNRVNGDWSELFTTDEAVIMAMILSADIKAIESDFLNISYNDQDKLIKCVLDLSTKINFWFIRLEMCRHKSGKVLAQKIAAIIDEKLAVELHTVKDIASQTKSNLSTQFSEFCHVWRLSGQGDTDTSFKQNISEFEHALNVHKQLRSSFYVFLNSLSYLKTITPIFFQESLGSQQHDPAVGLFIVFLKLYEKSQNRLNTFTQRHLDFYYNKLLNVKNRGESPESIYLLFKTLPGTNKALINKATEFSAGKDKLLNEIIYCADDNLVVTDAKVQSLTTLYLQQDKLIAPECELGYVTRTKSNHLPISSTTIEEKLSSWSLFGAEKKGTTKIPSNNATIGFSVASPILLLQEGVRKIDIGVELKSTSNASIKTLISDLLNCKTKAGFTKLFGRLFSHYLLTFSGCLTFEHKHQIATKARSILSESVSNEIDALLQQDWQGLFYKLFQNAFCIQLTTDNGWLNVDSYSVVPYLEDSKSNRMGLRIKLNLGGEIEPITPYKVDVHNDSLETKLPVLQCRINPQAHFYPYSIFQDLVIDSLQINVDAKGIKNILAYNQHGRLDPASPFNPFGPLPTSNSFFVFGNYEIAKKNLIDLKMNLEWGELPRHPGGFSEYYRGYATKYSNSIFKGVFTALSDNSWQPYKAIDKPSFNLFEPEEESSRPAANKVIRINVVNHSKPIDAALSEEEYHYGTKAGSGFFRLSLIDPDTAFGHAEYPETLTKVLSANAKLKKIKLATPNPPYTPLLNRISLDYKASSRVDPTIRRDDKNLLTEKIIHMHPFGVETVYPSASPKPCYFLPQYTYEGNLFIGISATEIASNLTLFFHMSEESNQESTAATPTVSWFYLAANNWKPLSIEHVLSDATNGFLSSGAITLNIPNDINSDNSVMPGGCFWLRVSCMQGASSFSNCHAVQTNALKVTKKMRADIGHQQLPENIKWSSIYPIAGISGICQVGELFGGRPKESDIELKTRISERLRHKNRAQLPWDYERLILKQFPEIKKVKCFSSISSTEEKIKPGDVLIVVVPHASSSIDETCAKVIVNPDKLNQIKSYVKNLSSPFAKIEVRNPVYEQVQVRCTVKFANGLSDGVSINRLNQDISDYICPWKKTGYKSRFGWSIRQRNLESYIRSLNYVEFITNFSMLHITIDSTGDYSLFDTAKNMKNGDAVIRPRYPWSLAIPAKKHFIEMQQVARSVKAEITGVNELAVGGTFIISGSSEYGQEE